ncbi:hypothetical protein NMY22_g16365 [Coprinellus aureogranulatus]|nr:hypothetical protein NMY22_g16365 [Coprinellus aureogranulatus]
MLRRTQRLQRQCTRRAATVLLPNQECRRQAIWRALSSTSGTQPTVPAPWFVEPKPIERPALHSPLNKAALAPQVPAEAPQLLKDLQSELLRSPHLDLSTLVVCRAVPPPPGPSLPERLPQGKRRRGGTIAGESAYDFTCGIWSWFVFAQVKEGTEGRGAVESVVRQVRKSLLSRTPPVTLPPKSRRQMGTGWALLDGGNFAVHILTCGFAWTSTASPPSFPDQLSTQHWYKGSNDQMHPVLIIHIAHMSSFNSSTAPSESPAFHVHPGIANPTASNNIDGFSRVNPNFGDSPNTRKFGAGSGPEFLGQKVPTERPGMNEYDSGMLDSTNIDPLNENSNRGNPANTGRANGADFGIDDGWANATTKPGAGGPSATGKTATGFVAGVAKLAVHGTK